MDLDELLDAIRTAAANDVEANHTVAASHLADSQLVIANIAALRASKDPLSDLVSALVVASSDPTERAKT